MATQAPTLTTYYLTAQAHTLKRQDLTDRFAKIEEIRSFCSSLMYGGAVVALLASLGTYKGRTIWLRFLPIIPGIVALAAWTFKKFAPHPPLYNTFNPVQAGLNLEDFNSEASLVNFAIFNIKTIQDFVTHKKGNKTDIEAAAQLGLIFNIIACFHAAAADTTPKQILSVEWISAANLDSDLERRVNKFASDFNSFSNKENARWFRVFSINNVKNIDVFLKEMYK